jgi:hypothetical protein
MDEGGPEHEPWMRTPELQRWQETWSQALEAEPWVALRNALRAEFPGHELGTHAPAYHSACYTCIAYLPMRPSAPASGRPLIRVAGAISLLAPVYLVYGTVEPPPADRSERDQLLKTALEELRNVGSWEERFARFTQAIPPAQQLHLRPTEEMAPTAAVMARVIERTLGHRPFPVELATLPVPDIRVPSLHSEGPTLLSALFSSDLASLP